MIRRLLARFDLAERHLGIIRRLAEHFAEQLRRHEVGAGCRGEIAAAREELQRLFVDLPIAAVGAVHRAGTLREGGRIEDDHVILSLLPRVQLVEQREHIRRDEAHAVGETVLLGIAPRHGDGVGGDIHRVHMLCPRLRRVQREGAGMREAVEHRAACRQLRCGEAVVFLIEEEAGLLAVHEIDAVGDAVLADLGLRHRRRGIEAVAEVEAAALLHALQRADVHIVALIDGAHRHAHFGEHAHEGGKDHVLAFFDAERQRLRHQHIAEAIDGQAGKLIRLAEDQAAAEKILRRMQHGAAVFRRPADAALPEGGVECVIGVGGEHAHADPGGFVIEAGTEIASAAGINIAQPAVFGLGGEGFDIGFVHPDVPRAHTRLGAVVDGGSGIDSFRHKMLPFYEMDEDIIPQVP